MTKQAQQALSALGELPMSQQIWVIQEILGEFNDFEEKGVSKSQAKGEPWETPEFFAELDRRYEAVKRGKVSAIPMEEVLEKMRLSTG